MRESHMAEAIKLIESGGNPNTRDKYNNTLLHSACDSNDIDAVRYLIENGASVHIANNHGNTPFHYAAWHNSSIDTVRYLIENGASVHIANNRGNTPFHYAVWHNPSIEMIQYLLDKGADRDAINNDNQTAAGRARYKQNYDIAEFIESYDVPTKGVQCE